MHATIMQSPLTLDGILDRAAQHFPEREIVSKRPGGDLHRYGYADLRARARALAAGLQALGLEEGEPVATLMWNHHQHLEVYFGVPLAGGAYHTLNPRLAPEDLVHILRDAGNRYLIVDESLAPLLKAVEGQVELAGVYVVRGGDAPLAEGCHDYEDLLTTGDSGYQPLAPDEDRVAGLCYTSGTTGQPKGVAYSHRALVLHSLASALPDCLDLSANDVVLPVVPMFHANAWGLPFTAAMVGASLVMPGPDLSPVALLDLYAGEGVTASAGVPTVWTGILAELEKDASRWDLTEGLRMVVGGSAAPEAMIRAFDRHGLEVLHAWGMTETSPLGSVSRPVGALKDLDEDTRYAFRARQGVPAPLVEIRAVDDEGAEVAWDGQGSGELQVRGPWVASSYVGGVDPDKWTEDGWFRTGDVVRIHAGGYLEIVDRTKDMIKSGGEWISSIDLENLLMAHPAVREAAVVAVPSEKWGERPLAVVALAEGAQAEDDELRAHLAAKFPRWALPDGFVRLDALPRTATGKFLKRKLREDFRGWSAGAACERPTQ